MKCIYILHVYKLLLDVCLSSDSSASHTFGATVQEDERKYCKNRKKKNLYIGNTSLWIVNRGLAPICVLDIVCVNELAE